MIDLQEQLDKTPKGMAKLFEYSKSKGEKDYVTGFDAFVGFFESVGVYIKINPEYNVFVEEIDFCWGVANKSQLKDGNFCYKENRGECDNRPEAQVEAVKKAFEILEKLR